MLIWKNIPISIKANAQTNFEFIALLDSGADVSVIPQDVAELLNLDLTKKKENVRGIGGWLESIEEKISVTISKGHESYSFIIPIKIILGGEEKIGDIPIILGREGFFDKFKITFDQANERVSLKWNSEKKFWSTQGGKESFWYLASLFY